MTKGERTDPRSPFEEDDEDPATILLQVNAYVVDVSSSKQKMVHEYSFTGGAGEILWPWVWPWAAARRQADSSPSDLPTAPFPIHKWERVDSRRTRLFSG